MRQYLTPFYGEAIKRARKRPLFFLKGVNNNE
uniref:Uncharacterized protein n=1 Tax=Siphoviridae sp. ctTIi48 TaxID=2827875 RepID=A0A8S5TLS3_9CAUD|nr:MAG TPA: hypothetical protein [Siphoviridae sp. ctTIi48]